MANKEMIEIILLAINIVVGICGLQELAGGTLLMSLNLPILGVIALIFGCVTAIVAIMGIVAVKSESKFYIAFDVGLSLVLFLHIALCALTFQWKNDGDLEKRFMQTFNDYWEDLEDTDKQASVDHIQNFLGCCGGEGPHEWTTDLPASCYEDSDKKKVRKQGCIMYVHELTHYLIGIPSTLVMMFVVVIRDLMISLGKSTLLFV